MYKLNDKNYIDERTREEINKALKSYYIENGFFCNFKAFARLMTDSAFLKYRNACSFETKSDSNGEIVGDPIIGEIKVLNKFFETISFNLPSLLITSHLDPGKEKEPKISYMGLTSDKVLFSLDTKESFINCTITSKNDVFYVPADRIEEFRVYFLIYHYFYPSKEAWEHLIDTFGVCKVNFDTKKNALVAI
ncbi:MAG: hypothetical protein MJ244_04470 [Clostridia bacterium]|nr:hypothetical protein [Clostridia bacterium]